MSVADVIALNAFLALTGWVLWKFGPKESTNGR